jgi:hypothetical protein
LDAKEAFAKVMPAMQQILQTVQKLKPQPQMDGSDQVILQTSMAETKRRAERDAKELAIQEERLKNDALSKNREQQIKIALNASDNLTEERIKTAELTQDAAVLKSEQEQTALAAQASAQRTLGV